MTIEGVLISNKEGKLIFYRSYSKISHNLFEDFAYSLPQKIKIEAQHTFSIHGNYRLNYLPIEDTLLLVLVVSPDSNIIEDIESVGKMKEIVFAVIGQNAKEENVYDNFIDLAFAFDDMINLKMRNAISKHHVMDLLEMDSANEKMHNAILKNREDETRKKNELEIRKIEKSKKIQKLISNEMTAIDQSIKEFERDMGLVSKDDTADKQIYVGFDNSRQKATETTKITGMKTMKLGSTNKKKSSNLTGLFSNKTENRKVSDKQAQEEPEYEEAEEHNPLSEELLLNLEERLQGKINTEGEFTKLELKGILYLYLVNQNLSRFYITTENHKQKGLSVKVPPSFDKKLWAKGILALKDKSGPLQPKTQIETLKYSVNFSNIEETCPFSFSFWFSGNEFSCELKFNEDQTLFKRLQNIEVRFEKVHSSTVGFRVQDIEESEWHADNGYLVWKIPLLDEETCSASFIVNFNGTVDEETVFPAEVHLNSDSTIYDINMTEVTNQEQNEVKYEYTKKLVARDLIIG